ncbi:hypothetical protein NM688_g6973 [Phlebia brevispora]|uniref:Uncharacterized protein n=1 Tax=Phlebia brevispora TaxID=194682 RepID=A0ACC1SAG8_9APHY|nr:hypothetical protein NM688_g6973 [Phlebia brevispora]
MSMPEDPYELLHFNMVRAHDTFKLGYDKIIEVAANVPQNDLNNFLGYCEAWAKSLEDHHDNEESVVFPFLNTKMDISKEKEQHEVIHGTLNKLLTIIYAAKANHAKFDSQELLQLMTDFREPLYTHLDEEVEHITADQMKAAGFVAADIVKMIADLEAYAKSHANPFLQVPYMRSHIPAEYKDVWPPLPWVLKKVIIPYVLAKRYSGYWKYSPYPMS